MHEVPGVTCGIFKSIFEENNSNLFILLPRGTQGFPKKFQPIRSSRLASYLYKFYTYFKNWKKFWQNLNKYFEKFAKLCLNWSKFSILLLVPSTISLKSLLLSDMIDSDIAR